VPALIHPGDPPDIMTCQCDRKALAWRSQCPNRWRFDIATFNEELIIQTLSGSRARLHRREASREAMDTGERLPEFSDAVLGGGRGGPGDHRDVAFKPLEFLHGMRTCRMPAPLFDSYAWRLADGTEQALRVRT
jgi:hypothetical protein